MIKEQFNQIDKIELEFSDIKNDISRVGNKTEYYWTIHRLRNIISRTLDIIGDPSVSADTQRKAITLKTSMKLNHEFLVNVRGPELIRKGMK